MKCHKLDVGWQWTDGSYARISSDGLVIMVMTGLPNAKGTQHFLNLVVVIGMVNRDMYP